MKTAIGNGMKYLMTASVVQVTKVEKETRQIEARLNGSEGNTAAEKPS